MSTNQKLALPFPSILHLVSLEKPTEHLGVLVRHPVTAQQHISPFSVIYILIFSHLILNEKF